MIATSSSRSCVLTPEPSDRSNGKTHPEPATCITVVVAGINNTSVARALLKPHQDIEVFTQTRDAREAVKLVAILSPDVLLLDIDMPVADGTSAVAEILAACPETKIVTFSETVKQADVEEYFRAGAVGFVGKHAAAELPASIRAAHGGRYFFAP